MVLQPTSTSIQSSPSESLYVQPQLETHANDPGEHWYSQDSRNCPIGACETCESLHYHSGTAIDSPSSSLSSHSLSSLSCWNHNSPCQRHNRMRQIDGNTQSPMPGSVPKIHSEHSENIESVKKYYYSDKVKVCESVVHGVSRAPQTDGEDSVLTPNNIPDENGPFTRRPCNPTTSHLRFPTRQSHRLMKSVRKSGSFSRPSKVSESSDTDDDTTALSQDRSFWFNYLKQFCKHCGRNLQVPNSDCTQHFPERKPYPEGSFRYRVSKADDDSVSHQYKIKPANKFDSGLPSSAERISWSEWRSLMNEICDNERKLAASKEVTKRVLFVRHFFPQNQCVYGLHGYFNRINTGVPLTVEEQRQYEWLRFITFSEYQGEGNGIVLARNGFYHEPEQGPAATRCFACGVQRDQWQLFDDVEAEHRRLSPNCPLLHGNRGEGIRHNISIVADDIERARQNQARRAAAAAPAAAAAARNPPPASREEQRPNQNARPAANPASVPGGASNAEPGVTSLAQTGHTRARTRTPDSQPTSLARAGGARPQIQPLFTQPTALATGFTPQSGGNLTVTTVTGGQQETVSSVCFLMLSSCKYKAPDSNHYVVIL